LKPMKNKGMHLFKNTVFQETDNRAKTVFRGLGALDVGPAPEFDGKVETLNPEEMFVAAINACLMTTFFYFAQKLKVEFLSYYSEAKGRLEKQTEGFRFTNVEVRAEVALQQTDLAGKVLEAGNLAEKYCLISRSVTCPVDYQLKVEIRSK